VASEYDETDFIDGDYEASRRPDPAASTAPNASRPPSREDLEHQVSETHSRLDQLKRAQEELERERVALEEARRRRSEFHTGREEMVQHLTRGIGLLQESEFCARRDAEQMAKTLGELRDSLVKVQSLNDEVWTKEQYAVELTKALTTIENSRMEWNSAQLKWPVLNRDPNDDLIAEKTETTVRREPSWTTLSFGQLCRLGFALTWPVALVLLGAAIATIVLILRN